MSRGLYLHVDWDVTAAAVGRELGQPAAVVIVHAMHVPAGQVAHHGQAVAAEHGLLDDDALLDAVLALLRAIERRGGGAW